MRAGQRLIALARRDVPPGARRGLVSTEARQTYSTGTGSGQLSTQSSEELLVAEGFLTWSSAVGS